MSDKWITLEQLKEGRDRYKPVSEMINEGCTSVMCKVRGHDKYDSQYRTAVVVSFEVCLDGYLDYTKTKYKCDKGYTWDSAYAIDVFGEPLTVYAYNKMRSVV